MILSGANYIGFKTSAKGKETFKVFSPARNEYLPGDFSIATKEEFESGIYLSDKAFISYKNISGVKKAGFLDAIAEEIMELGDELIERCSKESGLPPARIRNERGRTCGQLRIFSQLLRDGWWVDARLDTGQPLRKPSPKPDIRRMLTPIGPVVVFGSSNFPLAFSTAGGDTVSALAAGCPVIFKAHPAHAGTNELISSAITKASVRSGMPEGVFSSLYLSDTDAVDLVRDPRMKAVGFTGSRRVGLILSNAAMQRAEPIPVYAEMSAVNPVILMENALQTNKQEIAEKLANSVTLGAGQFCTNPGLIFLIDSEAAQSFLALFSEQIAHTTPATLLGKNIYEGYTKGIERIKGARGVTVLSESARKAQSQFHEAQPAAFLVGSDEFNSNKRLSDEIFGPSTLVVLCKDISDLQHSLQRLEGQLTATVHATKDEEGNLPPILDIIIQKAGRVIYGGYPTGVEVCHAMQHGGPFPSTTDSRSTSVGTAAIYRFVRPVAFQDFPDHLLPEELQNANSLQIMRLINGNWTTDQVSEN